MADKRVQDAEERAERAHFVDVLKSFNDYAPYMMNDLARRKQHLDKISTQRLARLPGGVKGLEQELTRLVQAVHRNASFTAKIAGNRNYYHDNFQIQQHESSIHPKLANGLHRIQRGSDLRPRQFKPRSAERHMSKVKSTLHQCVREWSTDGAEERKQCFEPLIAELEKYLPITPANKNKQKVLVPGSGLGRMVLELSAKGYSTQGNEFDYFMLMTTNLLLNRTEKPEQFGIHPWIDKRNNLYERENARKLVRFPDVAPLDLIGDNPGYQMSMCAGEFLEVYRKDVGKWDGLVTCFFIDTAPNIFDYIEAFHRILTVGGVWTSIGPLMYHWSDAAGDDDERFGRSIELSFDEIRHVIKSYGFEFLSEERRYCKYAINSGSMLQNQYNVVQFTVRKLATPPAPPAPPAPAVKKAKKKKKGASS